MTRALKCSCGGALKATILTRIDLEPLFGLHGWFEGAVRGLRCKQCESDALVGPAYERILLEVTWALLALDHILANEQARFLRKVWLGLTQDQLAERMSIHKITVADWERGERALSKEHDYELRGIALSALLRHPEAEAPTFTTEIAAIQRMLTAPRTTASPKRRGRYVIRARAA